jgi:hypothetical protein
MPNQQLSKFSSQANPEILNSLKELAQLEGRKMHAILDEALRDYLVKKGMMKPSQSVMNHFAQSLHEFDELYKKLAK